MSKKKITTKQIRDKTKKIEPIIAPKNRLIFQSDAVRKYSLPVLTAILSLALLVALSHIMGLFPKVEQPLSNGDNIMPQANYQTRVFWEIPADTSQNIRDITQLGKSGHYDGQLVVRGILFTEDNASAIIGKGIVREGDEVMGAKIIDIGLDFVEFEMKGKTWIQKVEK